MPRWVEVLGHRYVSHGAYRWMWALRLSCGHWGHRSAGEPPPRGLVCGECPTPRRD